MAYQAFGKTMAHWDEKIPLMFTLTEEVGNPDARRTVAITIDLTELQQGFTADFLLHLKDLMIHWRSQVSLNTLQKYCERVVSLFRKVNTLKLFSTRVAFIDETFLLALSAARDQFCESQLKQFKSAFTAAPYSLLWAKGLHASDFPLVTQKKSFHGQKISQILEKALTRAACVSILSRCEQAYDLGELDIGHFAFVNLAFAVYCRPESYRQIELGDLVFDEKTRAYFLYIIPAKTGDFAPQKIAYRINEPLGILLQKQRQNVVNLYGHLVRQKDIKRLALFPARRLNKEKSGWLHSYANNQFGSYQKSIEFVHAYPKAIKRKILGPGFSIGANVLRHTVGTQLAQTGASAQTIQAVLKHATDSVCQAYVDIAFHGLIDSLSDAMLPAFETHIPVFARFRSKNDPIDVQQAVRSDDWETGKVELTGECGKRIQCEFAPITCYGCVRFIPCWDADHSVNLTIVQREIDDYKRRGQPFRLMVEKAQMAKYHIILVMNAVDRYKQDRTLELHA